MLEVPLLSEANDKSPETGAGQGKGRPWGFGCRNREDKKWKGRPKGSTPTPQAAQDSAARSTVL